MEAVPPGTASLTMAPGYLAGSDEGGTMPLRRM